MKCPRCGDEMQPDEVVPGLMVCECGLDLTVNQVAWLATCPP